MIRIEHNAEDLAEAISDLEGKPIQTIRKRALFRALTAGRKLAKNRLKLRMKAPKGQSWSEYYKAGTKIRVAKDQSNEASGYLQYSSKTRGLRNYTTKGRLDRHRKQTNRHIAESKKTNPRYAKPLVFDLIPGKKTKLKRTFVGSGKGNSGLQVFRRSKDGKDIERLSGHSLAGQLRSQRNKNIRLLQSKKMRDTFLKSYRDSIKFKFDRAVSRSRR